MRGGDGEEVGCGDSWREQVRAGYSHLSALDRAQFRGSWPAHSFVLSIMVTGTQTDPPKSSQLDKKPLTPP